MKAETITYTGTVQGVGFRATVRQLAEEIGIKGWVRNNDDGTVTLHAEGTDEQIKGLRERIRASGVGRIDEEREAPGAKPEDARAFRIVH